MSLRGTSRSKCCARSGPICSASNPLARRIISSISAATRSWATRVLAFRINSRFASRCAPFSKRRRSRNWPNACRPSVGRCNRRSPRAPTPRTLARKSICDDARIPRATSPPRHSRVGRRRSSALQRSERASSRPICKPKLSSPKMTILYFFRRASSPLVETNVPPLRRVSRDSELPLSFAQRRLWFLDRLEPGNTAYNLGASRQIPTAVDAAILETAVNEVVRRHEILRSDFSRCWRRARASHTSRRSRRAPPGRLTAVSDADLGRKWTRLKSEEAKGAFDLAKGPLLRTTLLKLRPNENVLLFTMHHIIADGWSLGIFLRDVNLLISEFSQRTRNPRSQPARPVSRLRRLAKRMARRGKCSIVCSATGCQVARRRPGPAVADRPAAHCRADVSRRGAYFLASHGTLR